MTTTLNVTDLNFDTIKANLKTYMKSQSDFTDYEFEASGLSYLLDVLAYNTHYNAVLANFAANEMFLDTALKRTSVISHAKSLGYHPRSKRAARANIRLVINKVTGTPPNQLLLPRGTKFTTSKNNTVYNFVTASDYVAPKVGTNDNYSYTYPDIEIVEGTFFNFALIATGDYTTKYIIPNPNVDISTLTMRVYSYVGESANATYYKHSSTLIDITETDNVFFTQEADNNLTEFYFGNGTSVGVLPALNNVIQLEYICSNGSNGNDIRTFSLYGSVDVNDVTVNSNDVSISLVEGSGPSTGGVDEESIDEIKYNASKHFTVQNRAVTAFDYKSIISQNFFNIESIKVWGGEDNNPIQYNTVYVCIKPALHDYLTEKEKDQIRAIINTKSVMNMKVIFVDPEYLNLVVTTLVYYSPSMLDRNSSLQSIVQTAITNYSDTQLQAFSQGLKYSKFIAMIDETYSAITHNTTSLRVYKTIPVEVNKKRLYNINFSNAISPQDYTIVSDPFNVSYNNSVKSVFLTNIGSKMVLGYRDENNNFISIQDTGTVDYTTGLVSLTPLLILSYEGDSVGLYMTPQNNDIDAKQNNIIRILASDVNITIKAEV